MLGLVHSVCWSFKASAYFPSVSLGFPDTSGRIGVARQCSNGEMLGAGGVVSAFHSNPLRCPLSPCPNSEKLLEEMCPKYIYIYTQYMYIYNYIYIYYLSPSYKELYKLFAFAHVTELQNQKLRDFQRSKHKINKRQRKYVFNVVLMLFDVFWLFPPIMLQC